MNELFVPFNAKGGRPRKFAYPTQLLNAFSEYLEDRKERFIEFGESEEGISGKSIISKTKKEVKHHPLSIADFCIFLGCSRAWWNALPEGFLGVKSYIGDYIFSYQLKGAEIGEFNANIVARELGLAEKKDISSDTPVKVEFKGFSSIMPSVEGIEEIVKEIDRKRAEENVDI